MEERLDWLFEYHPATPEQTLKYGAITKAAKEFARVILTECPECDDQSVAFRAVREARMWANAAIACNGVR